MRGVANPEIDAEHTGASDVMEPRDLSAGDVVQTAKPRGVWRTPSGGDYVMALWFTASFTVMQLQMVKQAPRILMLPALMLVAIFGIWELGSRSSQRWGRRLLGSLPQPGTLSDLAHECLLRGALMRGRGWFDAAHWLERAGPDAPRVICVDLALDPVAAPDDVYEETDMATGLRGIRRRLYLMSAWCLVLAVCVVWAGMRGLQLWGYGLAMAMIMSGVLAQLGFVPMPLRAAIVSPGRITFAGLYLMRGTFTREDSVLVVSNTYDNTLVKFCRRDGKSATMWFPGLRNVDVPRLLARWCLPAAERRGRVDQGVELAGG